MKSVDLELTRHFAKDFDIVTAGLRKGYKGPAYALVRFADGEAAILRGEQHRAESDHWQVDGGRMSNLVDSLQAALSCDLPGWHVGITAFSHHPEDHKFLLENVDVPLSRVTFAELFIFMNWQRFRDLDLSHCRIVGAGASGPRGFDIPLDAVEDDDFDIEPILEWMFKGSGPILLAAGPLSKRIAFEYWWTGTHSNLRCDVCLDVGSALSPMLRRRKTRKYHSPSHPAHLLVPKWKA